MYINIHIIQSSRVWFSSDCCGPVEVAWMVFVIIDLHWQSILMIFDKGWVQKNGNFHIGGEVSNDNDAWELENSSPGLLGLGRCSRTPEADKKLWMSSPSRAAAIFSSFSCHLLVRDFIPTSTSCCADQVFVGIEWQLFWSESLNWKLIDQSVSRNFSDTGPICWDH